MTLLDKIRIVQTPLREQPTFLRRHFVNDFAGLGGIRWRRVWSTVVNCNCFRLHRL